jgi:NAD(P)-dependent dehydrogenase (short-subunit alcohol dehydrogenase family)
VTRECEESGLREKSVIINGGGGEIGLACAKALLAAGANVLLSDIRSEQLLRYASDLRTEFPSALIETFECDVTKQEDCFRTADYAEKTLGTIDISVNLAGIISPCTSLEVTQEDWERLISVNLNGTFFCCQAVARVMVRNGGGSIVNTSSIAAGTAWPARASYGASKAAVSELTKTLAVEWASHGIRVNAVAPGWVETDLLTPAVKKGFIDIETIKNGIPMKRIASKEDVANTVTFLASAQSSYITGQTIFVDGGYLVGSPSIAITKDRT